jgi:hypothetical protein
MWLCRGLHTRCGKAAGRAARHQHFSGFHAPGQFCGSPDMPIPCCATRLHGSLSGSRCSAWSLIVGTVGAGAAELVSLNFDKFDWPDLAADSSLSISNFTT